MRPLSTLAAATLLTLVSAIALAQSFPSKPIKVIVPYVPGGGTDVIARILAQKASEGLGQQMVIDNRAGAGGILGAEIAAKSPGDGYTLFMGSGSTIAMAPSLYPKLGYDPAAFVPVSLFATAPFLIVVNPAVPAHSVKELIALAKAKPGTLTFGSAGNGNILHVAGELFKSLAGVDMVHVPYKGAAPALIDMLAGRIDIMFEQYLTFQQHIPGGKVRVLAVAAAKRHQQLPDVPTAAEAGLPGFEVFAWFGLFGPAGMPASAVNRVNAEVQKALATKEMRDTLATQGIDPQGGSPESFAVFIKNETAKWGKVIKTASIKVE